MRPADESQEPSPQEEEIEACTWMPLEEYFKVRLYTPGSVYERMMEITRHAVEGRYEGLTYSEMPIGFGRPGNNVLYHVSGEFGEMELPETDLKI